MTSPSQGFTLLELMIALAIGSVIVLGTISAYLSHGESTRNQLALISQTEALGKITTVLSKEVRRSGHGLADPTTALTVLANGLRIRYQPPGAGAATQLDYIYNQGTDTLTLQTNGAGPVMPVHAPGLLADFSLNCFLTRAGVATACNAGDQPLAIEFVLEVAGNDNARVTSRESRFTATSRNHLIALVAP